MPDCAKFHQNRSNGLWDIMFFFDFSRWQPPLAIFDSKVSDILLADWDRRTEIHHQSKFCPCQSMRCGDIVISQSFNMITIDHLVHIIRVTLKSAISVIDHYQVRKVQAGEERGTIIAPDCAISHDYVIEQCVALLGPSDVISVRPVTPGTEESHWSHSWAVRHN